MINIRVLGYHKILMLNLQIPFSRDYIWVLKYLKCCSLKAIYNLAFPMYSYMPAVFSLYISMLKTQISRAKNEMNHNTANPNMRMQSFKMSFTYFHIVIEK